MNFNAGNVVMFGVGVILIYAAIKKQNPKEVVQNAFQTSATPASGKSGKKATNRAATSRNGQTGTTTAGNPVGPLIVS